MLVNDISQGLGLPPSFIEAWSRKASHAYKTYTIPKRSGGQRIIHHPASPLKAIQRWLANHVISKWPVHHCATAYRSGTGIQQNAELHAHGRYLLRLDFKDFFPAITLGDINEYLKSPTTIPSWNEADILLFTSLVCREGRLTIGAPTSPPLSNAICFKIDSAIEAVAVSRSVVYSRYADDIFLSANTPGVLKEFPDIVSDILSSNKTPAGLTLNKKKTRHSSKRARRQVTGLVLQSDGKVGVGRERKRMVRALIHKHSTLSDKKKDYLAGMLSFIQGLEPDFINSLILKYGLDVISRCRKGSNTTQSLKKVNTASSKRC